MRVPNPNGKRLLGLCSVAVTAVYAAGYLYTQPTMQTQANSSPVPLSHTAPAVSGTRGHAASPNRKGQPSSGHAKTGSGKGTSHVSRGSASHVKKKPAAHKAAHKKAALYKDGTYTGFGSNPYGTLSVAVHIQHGKIASVQITSYNMHYSPAYIDPQLPQEAVSMQTWRIYIVSGATASSYNFAEAVYYALQKAKA
jgi:uncharacterized protein with FMN-binding domain